MSQSSQEENVAHCAPMDDRIANGATKAPEMEV